MLANRSHVKLASRWKEQLLKITTMKLKSLSALASALAVLATCAPGYAENAPANSGNGLNFKFFTEEPPESQESTQAAPAAPSNPAKTETTAATPAKEETAHSSIDDEAPADGTQIASRKLTGYIRVVPVGTKIPIIMDSAVDSDTSQEGDEFTARSSEDLSIDGSTVLPAGSIIKGRIAKISPPKTMGRSGAVSLKFDTVTTPDDRQIPIVANLVAHGGVVHARRGLKDIAIDGATITLPTAAGLGIGLLAGGTGQGRVSPGVGAGIGAGVGVAVGAAILLIKKGKRVDVRPGDELKIELGEDLRMPVM